MRTFHLLRLYCSYCMDGSSPHYGNLPLGHDEPRGVSLMSHTYAAVVCAPDVWSPDIMFVV